MAGFLVSVRGLALPAVLVASVVSTGAAFTSVTAPLPVLRARTVAASPAAGALRASAGGSGDGIKRRDLMQLGAFAVLSGAVNVAPASAKRARAPPVLQDPDGNPETPEERKARVKAERQAADEARKAADAKAKEYEAENGVAQTEMGSNLRGDYYYPTARKRYLPRVRKAYEELVKVEDAPNSGEWAKLELYAKGPGDAGSALKLYASALAGGGLSISGNFINTMKVAADKYDETFKTFQAAIKAKDASKASASLGDLKASLLAYREAGKPVGLTGDDWGVGAVPNCQRYVPSGECMRALTMMPAGVCALMRVRQLLRC